MCTTPSQISSLHKLPPCAKRIRSGTETSQLLVAVGDSGVCSFQAGALMRRTGVRGCHGVCLGVCVCTRLHMAVAVMMKSSQLSFQKGGTASDSRPCVTKLRNLMESKG